MDLREDRAPSARPWRHPSALRLQGRGKAGPPSPIGGGRALALPGVRLPPGLWCLNHLLWRTDGGRLLPHARPGGCAAPAVPGVCGGRRAAKDGASSQNSEAQGPGSVEKKGDS